jgi:hypothetical protein
MASTSFTRTPVVVTANIGLARRDLVGRRQVRAILEKPVRMPELLTAAFCVLAERAEPYASGRLIRSRIRLIRFALAL